MKENKNKNSRFVSKDDMRKEIRGLKRKLELAEASLARARLISTVQNRTETILNDSLKKEFQFFSLVLENITNILLLFDFDGRFAYASETFLKAAGIANFGLIGGRHFRDVLESVFPNGTLEKFSAAVEKAVVQKNTVSIENQIAFGSNKAPRMFYTSITPMIDDSGKITGIMALFNDITEINSALETANRANLAKSDFLASMSHEIRTPLNAVIGMTAIAQSSSDMDKIRYCLDKIDDSSKHLLGIINDILDMSKIESNHFELSFSDFVFEKMLLRIVNMIQFKIEEKHITFSLYCDPDIPYAILSDEQRLAQVIMNLLSNAVKFTPAFGSVSLRAEIESAKGGDYYLRISVKDSGIGISEEQKPRIFKVFSQADSSISRKFGGTGLGLSISKNIINMLGGDLWFDSAEGSGTTFTFNVKTRSVSLTPEAKICYNDVRILAVDDMPDVLLSFSTYAEKLGISCSVADSAKQAFELLEKGSYNIVFVDWKMPDIDGLSFVKSLGDLSGKGMIVIMISSADWSEVEKEAKSAGVKEFISKPILLPVIEKILDKYCEGDNKEAEKTDDFSDKTVLLVDDVEINREIIIAMLKHTGIKIICAENGKEAVGKFAADPDKFDLIFMDVQMPEIDGYEASRQIRSFENSKARTVPIIAMTAHVFKEDIEKSLASGMNAHIGKPVNIEEILSQIRRWTENTDTE
ncbi:MAG: response regulator [Endomicrobium sp.]|jgi:PAS domain S-box-containing protein|nr:response regulator [Endomicrobium sp.]